MITTERLGATQRPGLTGGLILFTLLAWWVAPFVTLPLDGTSTLFWQGALDEAGPILGPQALTAHLLHTDKAHLLWNLLGLAVLGYLVERRSRVLLLVAVGGGMGAVTLWFHLLSDTTYYVGWSGVLNCLFVCSLWTLYLPVSQSDLYSLQTRRMNNALVAVIAIGGLAKALWELAQGEALLTHTLWPSAPGAHLAGMLAGSLICGTLLLLRMPPTLRYLHSKVEVQPQ